MGYAEVILESSLRGALLLFAGPPSRAVGEIRVATSTGSPAIGRTAESLLLILTLTLGIAYGKPGFYSGHLPKT